MKIVASAGEVLQYIVSLCPFNIQASLPELDIRVYRYSQQEYRRTISCKPWDASLSLRYRILLLVPGDQGFHEMTLSGELDHTLSQKGIELPLDNIQDSLTESKMPEPGHLPIPGVKYVGLISLSRSAWVFKGRGLWSHPPHL